MFPEPRHPIVDFTRPEPPQRPSTSGWHDRKAPPFREIRYEVREQVATLTLCRPAKLNAYDESVMSEIRDAIWRANFDLDVRVVVLTGQGRAFCAGRDINSLGYENNLGQREFRAYLRANAQMLDDIEAMEKPVIAAINGLCVGGGVEIAAACDFRLAVRRATFQLPELRIGLIPASGAASRLTQMIGIGRVKELVMTGEAIDADEALRIGLVTRVFDERVFNREVIAYAHRFTEQAPLALGMAKHVINTCQGVDPATGRVIERLAQSNLVRSDDAEEGVAAFVAKRAPRFGGS